VKRLARNLAVLAAFILLAARAEASAQPIDVVNINTATETQLTYLPGVGDVLAGRIIEWREGVNDGQKKHITDVEQLLDVRGMGEARLSRIRPYLVLTGPTTLRGKVRTTKHAAIRPDAYRDLAGYPPATRASIERGLLSGHVRFEPSQYGGEYIWYPDGTR
jgi:competence ComEA-like helix-hairpin-helix protein